MSATVPLLEAIRVSVPAISPGTAPLPAAVDLRLWERDAIAVSGASGSGKTTLLRCLALLEARAVGQVRFQGRPVADADVPAFRRRVCYLPQTPPRFPFTVLESLAEPFQFQCVRESFDRERAAALCRRMLLPGDILGRELSALSGGEAQRVGLARTLLLEPTVLLADEPTSALDPKARAAVCQVVKEWLSGGSRAAVIVSHDSSVSDALATRHGALEGDALIEETLA